MKKDDNYPNEFKEWQDNQFNPGHYTGGKTPVWLKHPVKPKILGALFLLYGLWNAGLFIYELIYRHSFDAAGYWFEVIAPLIFTVLSILIGIKLLKKKN